jgi:membrane protease YdiL (CAAX protease family)
MPQRRIQLAGLVAALAVTAGLGTCSAAQALHVRDAVGLSLASLGLETSLGLLAWSGALLSTQRVGERLGLGPGRIGPRWLLLLVIGTLGVSQGLDGLLELSGLRSRSALSDLDMQLAGIRDGELGLALLAIGLVPGIAEEIFCRGLVQRGLERSLGPGVAIAAAALVFGALHLEPIHGAFATLLGVYLGVVAWLAGSVRAAILCHAANNAAAVTAAALLPEAPAAGPAGILTGFAVGAVCLGATLRRVGPPGPAPDAAELQPKPGSDDL